MGLYDGYQLANSTKIPEYQGSALPEMLQTAQVMQQRYDASEEGIDNASRYLSSLKALPGDEKQLNDLRNQFTGQIKSLAGRKDLENSVRDVSRLGKDLPVAYAGFAQRYKDYAEYEEGLKKMMDKGVDKGGITPETYKSLLALSIQEDKQRGGIKKDLNTGLYSGRFVGVEATPDISFAKRVDGYLTGAKETVNGQTIEYVNQKGDEPGYWINKDSMKRVTMPADRVRAIIDRGIASDPEASSWLKQQQRLGTYNMDFSSVKPEDLDLSRTLENRYVMKDGKIQKDKKGNPITSPYSLKDALQEKMSRGLSLTDALKELRGKEITDNIINNAHAYGTLKYQQNDIITGHEVSANPYALEKAKDETVPMTFQINQPVAGSKLDSPQAISDQKTQYDQQNKDAYIAYNKWKELNNVKAADPYSQGARFIGPDGKDMTLEAKGMIETQMQAVRAAKELSRRDQEIRERVGYKITPELEKKAILAGKIAYESAVKERATNVMVGMKTDPEKNRKEAIDRVLQSAPNYDKYKEALAENAKNDSAPIGVQQFKSAKLNKSMDEMGQNFFTNLDPDGVGQGTQGLKYASGPNAGNEVVSKDYKDVKGTAKFAGWGMNNEGELQVFYNVGDTKMDAKGKVIGKNGLYSMKAPPEILTNIIKEGHVNTAQLMLGQQITQALRGQTRAEIVVGPNQSVTVERVDNSDRSSGFAGNGVHYRVTYPGNNGGSKVVPAASISEATNGIISTIQKH